MTGDGETTVRGEVGPGTATATGVGLVERGEVGVAAVVAAAAAGGGGDGCLARAAEPSTGRLIVDVAADVNLPDEVDLGDSEASGTGTAEASGLLVKGGGEVARLPSRARGDKEPSAGSGRSTVVSTLRGFKPNGRTAGCHRAGGMATATGDVTGLVGLADAIESNFGMMSNGLLEVGSSGSTKFLAE